MSAPDFSGAAVRVAPQQVAVTDHAHSARSRRGLTAGEEIGARYRLQEVVGVGGMATVWRARDERLERPVALKVIADALTEDAVAVARFAREARTQVKIRHANIVRVHDYDLAARQPYIVMDYIAGATLSERLDRAPLEPCAIKALARELLAAVAAVHDHGVLHRDIKPANVLFDSDGHARLTDFGLAQLEGQITHSDEVVGTLRFLAPELLQGSPATRQSDLFGLGVLLRTVAGATELHPATGLTPVPDSPQHVADLIEQLTRVSPHDRPRDAHAALAQIDTAAISARTRAGSTPSRASVRAAPESSCMTTLWSSSSAVNSFESPAAACVSARSRIRRASGDTSVAAPARSLFA